MRRPVLIPSAKFFFPALNPPRPLPLPGLQPQQTGQIENIFKMTLKSSGAAP
jgi:hypothetical protein